MKRKNISEKSDVVTAHRQNPKPRMWEVAIVRIVNAGLKAYHLREPVGPSHIIPVHV